MTLLFPTSDGITLSSAPENAATFRLLEIRNGHISDDRLVGTGKSSFIEFLSDLSVGRSEITVVTPPALSTDQLLSGEKSYDYIETDERIITNVIIDYLKNHYKSESDYCCSP